MSSAFKLSKLAELRAKTDQQLVKVIDTELELGLTRVETKATNDFDFAGSRHIRAEKGYAEAVKLLAGVEDLTERQRLEWKLKLLRERLDRLSTRDIPRVLTARSCV